ncbi:RNA-guided pseudouridylation complex pseudouridine synthase subunit Cbf5 [Nanoarchaeota archaeon]
MVNIKTLKQNKPIKELLEFGIINIDKPSGPTSFQVSEFVKKSLGLRKTSHFGTLDPKVTGVLPVGLNRGCKLTGYFLGEDKTYVGIGRIHGEVSIDKLKKTIKEKFVGKLKQTPPVKSRVKRQEREREVYSFKVLEKEEKDFLFEVKCQGGTYVRKLLDDLGKELGTGAHMLELRRTHAGIFSESDKEYPTINLYDFEKAVKEYKSGNEELLRKIIIPAEIVSELHSIVEIKKEFVEKVLHGSPFLKSFLKKKVEKNKDEVVSVFSGEQFVGMFKVTEEGNIFARSEFSFQRI